MKYFSIAALSVLFWACGSNEKPYIQFPADTISRDLDSVKNFSIVLFDMDVTEDEKFMHKYKIVSRKNNAPEPNPADTAATAQTLSPADLGFEERITDWMEVSPEDFDFYSSDMGMEIYSKVDGNLNKVTAPPGYSQYVGNEKYGHWQTNPSTGQSFWAFYGQYMFISSMFHLMSPVPYGYYSGYSSYRGVTPYYGPQNNYGTGSSHASGMNADYSRRAATNTRLSQRVQGAIGSSSRATGGMRTASTTQSRSSSPTSRSSTRYSSSSRSRTSSGGGK